MYMYHFNLCPVFAFVWVFCYLMCVSVPPCPCFKSNVFLFYCKANDLNNGINLQPSEGEAVILQ